MIVAIVFDTEDTELVDSLATAAEWDEGISLIHASGTNIIENFRLLDQPIIDDNGGVTFEMDVES